MVKIGEDDRESDQFPSSFDHLTCYNQNMSNCQIFFHCLPQYQIQILSWMNLPASFEVVWQNIYVCCKWVNSAKLPQNTCCGGIWFSSLSFQKIVLCKNTQLKKGYVQTLKERTNLKKDEEYRRTDAFMHRWNKVGIQFITDLLNKHLFFVNFPLLLQM